MKACRYGKLKHKIGNRRCKLKRSSKHAKRGRRSGLRRHARKAAGISLGLLSIMGIGAVGAYAFFSSTTPPITPGLVP